jgi:hypothetical protein
MSRLSDLLDSWLTDGGEVVSLTRRMAALYPLEDSFSQLTELKDMVPAVEPILSQFHPPVVPTVYRRKVRKHCYLPCPCSSKCPFSEKFPHRNPVCIFCLSHRNHMLSPL